MDGDRDQQTTEVRETRDVAGDTQVTRQTVTSARATSGVVVLQRIIWYIAGVIIALLAIRIILLLLAANQGNAFVDFIYAVSGFFAWPFYGIFNYTPQYGQSVLEISSIVAIIIYALIAWGLSALVGIGSRRDDVV